MVDLQVSTTRNFNSADLVTDNTFQTATLLMDNWVDTQIIPVEQVYDKASGPVRDTSLGYDVILGGQGSIGSIDFEIATRSVVIPTTFSPTNEPIVPITSFMIDTRIDDSRFFVLPRLTKSGKVIYTLFLVGVATSAVRDVTLTVITTRVPLYDDPDDTVGSASLNLPLPDIVSTILYSKTVKRNVDGQRIYDTFILT